MKQLITLLILSISLHTTAQTIDSTWFHHNVITKVITYNNEADQLSEQLKTARTNQSPDTTTIKQKRTNIVTQCFGVPQTFIKDHPSSNYTIMALMMMGRGESGSLVSANQLDSMFKTLRPEVQQSEEGKAYAKQLYNWKWLYQLEAAAEASSMKSISYQEAAQQLQLQADAHVSVKVLPAANKVLSEEALIARLKQSTVIMNMAYRKKEGSKEYTRSNPATGYVIDASGICVTNYHVVKEYSSKEMYSSLSVMTAEGKSYPVTKVLSASQSNDLAIVQVDTKGDQLVPLPLNNAAMPGTPVFILSHPQQNFYQFTSGAVTGYRLDELGNLPCQVMTISAYFNVGSSGGAVADQYGNVVGTVSRISNGNERVAIPVEELKFITR